MARCITLTGLDYDSVTGKPVEMKIDFPMDNQTDGFGTAITTALFQQIVNRFVSKAQPQGNRKIAYVFGKQELLLLLCSKHCAGLAFVSCIRPDEDGEPGEESMVGYAIDDLGIPINWDNNKGAFKEGTNIVADEWIHGLTYNDIRAFLDGKGIMGDNKHVNLTEFFEFFGQKFANMI